MHARSTSPSLVDRVLEAFDRVAPPSVAHAHCDIPCGIYDPHAAQIAALTVVRMVQLIQGLQKPGDGADKAEWDTYTMQISRYANPFIYASIESSVIHTQLASAPT